MCGVFGFVGSQPAASLVCEGLRRLEYRGYDSAGIAVLGTDGKIRMHKQPDAPEHLELLIRQSPLCGNTAIGHTRWATHGKVNHANAHPHVSGRVAVVHNGVITNHALLRAELEGRGRTFQSETDTEVIPHLIDELLDKHSPVDAIRRAIGRLEGYFALAIIVEGEANQIFAVKKDDQPLIVGCGAQGICVSSDEAAMAHVATSVRHLRNEEIAVIDSSGVFLFVEGEDELEADFRPIAAQSTALELGTFDHWMRKEIYDQPDSIGKTFNTLFDADLGRVLCDLPHDFNFSFSQRITIVACGSAYHAGLIARYWFEELSGIPVEVRVASDYCDSASTATKGEVAIVLSQSGTTRDVLEAVKKLKEDRIPVLAIVNVPESDLTRLADGTIYTSAYPEVSVASTKAFTAQLVALLILAVEAGVCRGTLGYESGIGADILASLSRLPSLVEEVLRLEECIAVIARELSGNNLFLLGRGSGFPLALEGALKLKEICYLHAEGLPAGELKHGPQALITDGFPCIVIAPSEPRQWFNKLLSAVSEVSSRGSSVVALTDEEGAAELSRAGAKTVIKLPQTNSFVSPMIYASALQLFAYHDALVRGNSIDKPRNLAKSVTVD